MSRGESGTVGHRTVDRTTGDVVWSLDVAIGDCSVDCNAGCGVRVSERKTRNESLDNRVVGRYVVKSGACRYAGCVDVAVGDCSVDCSAGCCVCVSERKTRNEALDNRVVDCCVVKSGASIEQSLLSAR